MWRLLYIFICIMGLNFSFSTSALASNWVYVATDSEKLVSRIDTQSIIGNGPLEKFWLTLDYVLVNDLNDLLHLDKKLEEMQIDCSAKKIRTLTTIFYYKNGKNGEVNYDKSWESIPPDSVSESWMNFVCPKSPKRTSQRNRKIY